MLSPFTIDEFGISIVTPVPNPQDFSLDSLYRLGIVQRAWQLSQPPQCDPGQILFKFGQKTVLIQPNRIGFLHQKTNIDITTNWMFDSVERCLTCFPRLIYEGVGFSLTGYLPVPKKLGQTEHLLRRKLLFPKSWQPLEQVNPFVTLQLN